MGRLLLPNRHNPMALGSGHAFLHSRQPQPEPLEFLLVATFLVPLLEKPFCHLQRFMEGGLWLPVLSWLVSHLRPIYQMRKLSLGSERTWPGQMVVSGKASCPQVSLCPLAVPPPGLCHPGGSQSVPLDELTH